MERTVHRPLILIAGLLLACAPVSQAPGRWRPAALETARWLAAEARTVEGGVTWPPDALRPAELAPGPADAGPIALLLALGDRGSDSSVRALARRAAFDLAARLPSALDPTATPPATSLYYGWPFAARVLDRAGRLLDEPALTETARRIVAMVRAAARPASDSTVRWSPVYDDLLFGNAGTTLFMVWAARRFDDAAARDLAHRAALGLLARAEATPTGFGWRFRSDRPFVLPNFTHGAAGVGYAVLATGRIVADARLDSAAVEAGRALVAAADTTDGGFWVPYGWPEDAWRGRRDLGWAHGPAGTARLFLALDRVLPRAGWLEWAVRAGRGLVAHPAFLPSPVDDTVPNDFRFGRAGVAWFLADLADASGREVFRSASERLAAALLTRAVRDETGLRWVAPRASFLEHAGEPAALTGLLQGTAGLGLLLARLDRAGGEADAADWSWLVDPASLR